MMLPYSGLDSRSSSASCRDTSRKHLHVSEMESDHGTMIIFRNIRKHLPVVDHVVKTYKGRSESSEGDKAKEGLVMMGGRAGSGGFREMKHRVFSFTKTSCSCNICPGSRFMSLGICFWKWSKDQHSQASPWFQPSRGCLHYVCSRKTTCHSYQEANTQKFLCWPVNIRLNKWPISTSAVMVLQ